MNFLDFATDCLEQKKFGAIPEAIRPKADNDPIGYVIYWDFLKSLAEGDQASLIRDIHCETPDGNPLKIVSTYYMAGLEAWEGDVEKCFSHLERTLKLATVHMAFVRGNERVSADMQVISRLYQMINPSIDYEKVQPTKIEIETPLFEDSDKDFFFLSACNGVYFERFAKVFIQSISEIDKTLGVHIHIINPHADYEADKKELCTRYPNLRFTVEEGPDKASFYACRRLQIASQVMRHYGKSALVSDIDTTHTPEILRFNGLKDVPAGLFKVRHIDPKLMMHLSLVYYANCSETHYFLDHLDLYVTAQWNMGHGANWMLDQCSVLTVAFQAQNGTLNFEGEKHKQFRMKDLTATFGEKLLSFQINQDSSLAEKYDLREF